MTDATCIGFGEFDGQCKNTAGSSHSDLWCQRCDDLRLDHLTRQLAELEKSFATLDAKETTDA